MSGIQTVAETMSTSLVGSSITTHEFYVNVFGLTKIKAILDVLLVEVECSYIAHESWSWVGKDLVASWKDSRQPVADRGTKFEENCRWRLLTNTGSGTTFENWDGEGVEEII